MSPILDQITAYENRLRAEVMERECILAALKVLRTYADNGHAPQALELLPMAARLLGPMQEVQSLPAALPARPSTQNPAPIPLRKVHPELEKLGSGYGSYTDTVKWAIQRMTDDFSLLEIAELLEREGRTLKGAKISVVLTRLKSRGEIHEIARSAGPKPAYFRRPENRLPLSDETNEPGADGETSLAMEAAA